MKLMPRKSKFYLCLLQIRNKYVKFNFSKRVMKLCSSNQWLYWNDSTLKRNFSSYQEKVSTTTKKKNEKSGGICSIM